MARHVFADGRPRIVNIKGIRMDAEFGLDDLYHQPGQAGFIGRFSRRWARPASISRPSVGRDAPGGNAVALIESTASCRHQVLAAVRALPQSSRQAAAVLTGAGSRRRWPQSASSPEATCCWREDWLPVTQQQISQKPEGPTSRGYVSDLPMRRSSIR